MSAWSRSGSTPCRSEALSTSSAYGLGGDGSRFARTGGRGIGGGTRRRVELDPVDQAPVAGDFSPTTQRQHDGVTLNAMTRDGDYPSGGKIREFSGGRSCCRMHEQEQHETATQCQVSSHGHPTKLAQFTQVHKLAGSRTCKYGGCPVSLSAWLQEGVEHTYSEPSVVLTRPTRGLGRYECWVDQEVDRNRLLVTQLIGLQLHLDEL